MNISRDHYDAGEIVLHWMIAVLVLVVGAIALLWGSFRPYKPMMLNLHALLGLLMYALILLRSIRRLMRPAPRPADGVSALSVALASAVHSLLYFFQIAIPVIGLVSFIWHARTFDLGFLQFTPVVSAQKAIYQPTQNLHVWLSYAFMALISLHILAALWHQFVKRDGVLSRMLPALRAQH